MRDNENGMTGRKKCQIALALVLCMIIVGTAIGFGIVLFQPSGGDFKETSSYKVADNGYSGNSSQQLLAPIQAADYSTAVSEEVQNSVVTILTQQMAESMWGTSSQLSAGIGSGVIFQMDEDSVYVVTNAHVISEATDINLYYNEETLIPAQLQGSDEQSDIAVLSVNKEEIPAEILENMASIRWGDSDSVRVGDPSIAIGCPYGTGFGNSVTVGIIGGTERKITYNGITISVLQTDAAINPGNSGGALINEQGELIGINTAKVQLQSVEGMGFAIPSNTVKTIVDQLLEEGSIQHPNLGIAYYDFLSQAIADAYHVPTGIIIYEVEKGSSGEQAGLEVGDIITEIDGTRLESLDMLNEILDEHSVGDTIELTVIRNRDTENPLQLQLELSGNETEETTDFWG